MKSILEELLYGQIFPFERIVPHDLDRPLNQTCDYQQKLQKKKINRNRFHI